MPDINVARAKFLANPFRVGNSWEIAYVSETPGKPTGLNSDTWFKAGDVISFLKADGNGNPALLQIAGTAREINLDPSGHQNARNLFATTFELVAGTKITTSWVLNAFEVMVAGELMVRVKINAISNASNSSSPDGDVLTTPVSP